MFTVVISEKGGAERRETFERAELSVGRVQGNDLMLPKGNVSKRHARVLHRDGRFIVTDLNSTNGTYVNRRRITQATIVREGDRIYIGDFVLRIETGDEGEALSEKTGSGPVLSVPSSAHSSPEPEQRSVEPAASESVEDSGTSYPKVPGPPRVPTGAGARVDMGSELSSSGRLAIGEVVRPSLLDRVASTSQDERVDEEMAAQRRALTRLVEGVKNAVGLAVVPEEPDSGLVDRMQRALTEQLTQLLAIPEFSQYKFADILARAAKAELFDFGPLAGPMEDATVSEITASRFEHIVMRRDGQVSLVNPVFSSEAAMNLVIRRLCRRAGLPVASGELIVERRFNDETKLSAVLGTAAPAGALLVIRKPKRVAVSLEDLVRRGTISRAIATFMHQCMTARINILIVGPAGGGATSLLSALCAAAGDSQLVAIQEFEDVSLSSVSATRLSMPEGFDDAQRVLRLAALVSGSRTLVELSSRDISAAVVETIGEGADGVTAAMRAPSLRRALARLPADITASRVGMSIDAAREWVASSFEIAVEISKLRDGRQRVMRVSEIMGADGREIQTQDIFTFAIERTAIGGSIEGTFSSSGIVPRVAEEMRARGIALETSLFTRPPSR